MCHRYVKAGDEGRERKGDIADAVKLDHCKIGTMPVQYTVMIKVNFNKKFYNRD